MSCNDNDYVCRLETSITRSDKLPEGNLAGILIFYTGVWTLNVLDPIKALGNTLNQNYDPPRGLGKKILAKMNHHRLPQEQNS